MTWMCPVIYNHQEKLSLHLKKKCDFDVFNATLPSNIFLG